MSEMTEDRVRALVREEFAAMEREAAERLPRVDWLTPQAGPPVFLGRRSLMDDQDWERVLPSLDQRGADLGLGKNEAQVLVNNSLGAGDILGGECADKAYRLTMGDGRFVQFGPYCAEPRSDGAQGDQNSDGVGVNLDRQALRHRLLLWLTAPFKRIARFLSREVRR